MADLGLTSIDRLELVNYLEQEFRLDVDDSSIGPQTRVSDLRRTIEKREKPVGGGHFRFWTNGAAVRGMRRFWDAVFHYPVLRSVVTLEVQGGELLERLEGPVLFVSNHLSYLDQPCVMSALPHRLRYRTATAAWAEFFFRNFRNPLERGWKWFTYQYASIFLNVFPLPQSSGFSGSLRFMGKLADNGINILLFPEGEHSRDGSLGQFQPGLGLMVRELGVPVVPIKVTGTGEVLRPGSSRITPGKVTVRFGAPLRFRREEPDQIVVRTRQAVLEL